MTDYTNTHANSFNILIDLASAPNKAFAALHNAMVRMKWYMLRLPYWRASVLAALGGEAALARWEARATRSQTYVEMRDEDYLWEDTPPSDNEISKPPEEPQEKAKTRYKPFRTDADGLFRLARIAMYRPWVPRYNLSPMTPERRGTAGPRVWRMTPIAVTPEELRGAWREDQHAPAQPSRPPAGQVQNQQQCRGSAALDNQLITDVPRLARREGARPAKPYLPPRRYSRSHPL